MIMFRTSMHDKKNWIWQLQCCFYFICFSVPFFYYVGFSLLHWLESVNGRSLSSGCLFNERYLVQSRKLPAPCLSWGSRSCRGPAKGLRGGSRSMMQRSTNTEKNSFSYPEKKTATGADILSVLTGSVATLAGGKPQLWFYLRGSR